MEPHPFPSHGIDHLNRLLLLAYAVYQNHPLNQLLFLLMAIAYLAHLFCTLYVELSTTTAILSLSLFLSSPEVK